MDLSAAIEIAKQGRIASALDPDTTVSAVRPREDDLRSKDRESEIVPRLEPGEFDAWVEDVARAMVSLEGGEWYDLSAERQARWIKLAQLAVRATGEATIQRTLRRIRELQRPAKQMSAREVNEIERLAGVEADMNDLRAHAA